MSGSKNDLADTSRSLYAALKPPPLNGVKLRIPAFCEEKVPVTVNGKTAAAASPGSYAALKRLWKYGDHVQMHFPFEPRWMESHPYAAENTGKVALMRGPVLYCLEAVDHPGIDLRDVHVRLAERLKAVYRQDVLGGLVCLEGAGSVYPPDEAWEGKLYRRWADREQKNGEPARLLAVPYFRWANRQAGQMLVWLRRWSDDLLG